MEKMLTQLWKSFDVGTFKIMTFSTVIQPHTIYEELWKYVGENGRLGGGANNIVHVQICVHHFFSSKRP